MVPKLFQSQKESGPYKTIPYVSTWSGKEEALSLSFFFLSKRAFHFLKPSSKLQVYIFPSNATSHYVVEVHNLYINITFAYVSNRRE